jgi:hypothetical protein
MKRIILLSIISTVILNSTFAQQKADPKDTEAWSPVPKIVSPAKTILTAPEDAIILFGGKDLNQWQTAKDQSEAKWTVTNGQFTVKKGTGNIQSKKSFLNYQMHIEWFIPENITGSGQARGNSGIFLGSTGNGDEGYEYCNGQAGSIYKQFIPLVNASRKPGEWQSYDIIWTAPLFNENGSLKSAARVSVLHNGLLIQNNIELKGETVYVGPPFYKKHGALPIKLQDHGDPSEAISFRNIWIREL